MLLSEHLPYYELSLFQRIAIIWAFIAGGILTGYQLSQLVAENTPRWVVLDRRTKPYWYTFYVLEAFLLVQMLYRHVLDKVSGVLGGFEEQFLDTVWVGLLGLEVLMVAGVVLQTMLRAVGPKAKVPSKEL